jgi:hypothetical protein
MTSNQPNRAPRVLLRAPGLDADGRLAFRETTS